jgi:hypothetical protein
MGYLTRRKEMTKGEKEILNKFRGDIKTKIYITLDRYDMKAVLKEHRDVSKTTDEVMQELMDDVNGVYLDTIKRNNMTDEEYEEDGGDEETLCKGSEYYHKKDGNIEYN